MLADENIGSARRGRFKLRESASAIRAGALRKARRVRGAGQPALGPFSSVPIKTTPQSFGRAGPLRVLP